MTGKALHHPTQGKLRIIGFASGSGNTLWRTWELQKEMEATPEGCPFEIVGLFSDKETNKAVETAQTLGVPWVSLNIREFHQSHGASITDMEVRERFDEEVSKQISVFNGDMILLAGYVWATTAPLVSRYGMVNVHPADLSVRGESGRRFAGADGVGETIRAGRPEICSSAHLATAEIDGGPLLMRSPSSSIDYDGSLDEEQLRKKTLKAVNAHSRELGARTVLEIALGHFALSEDGGVLYQGKEVPEGLKINRWEENRPLFQRPITPMLSPESVAVIGASSKGGIGNAILMNILGGGYTGRAYAVNRTGESVGGVDAFQNISQLPEALEMAVITLPSGAVLEAVDECGRRGVKSVVCISAGFKEVGEAGAMEESKLLEITNRWNMRLLGPNCMGVLNTDPKVSLNATMLQHQPRKGNIAFITQSGALGAVLLDYAEGLGMGFSKIASLGNQMDITANDFLAELQGDDSTKVILLYLETIQNGPRFLKLVSALTKTKPVIIVKSGRSEAGAAAASSHTGSIAGSDTAVDALIEKAGAIRMDTLESAFAAAMVFEKLSPFNGKRIGVVTNAGGPGILIADRLAHHGFEMPLMPESKRKELAEKLFPEASVGNPVDVVAPAPPEHYAEALKAMAQSGCYDALAMICVPPATVDTGRIAQEAVVPLVQSADIPVISCFMGPTLGASARRVLHDNHLPCLDFPEAVADVLAAMGSRNQTSSSPEMESAGERRQDGRSLMQQVHGTGYLRTDAALKLLALYGLETTAWRWVESENGIAGIDLTYPLVAKIEHPEVLHKSDAGGVILNIGNREALAEAVKKLFLGFPGAAGVLIQEQANISQEVILGAKREEDIGHLCMIGAGGTLVELYRDVAFRLSPLSSDDADRMLRELKSFPMLQGYRGKEGVSLQGLQEYVMNFSRMLVALPEITEIDLNPVTYDRGRQKFMALDCRIRIG